MAEPANPNITNDDNDDNNDEIVNENSEQKGETDNEDVIYEDEEDDIKLEQQQPGNYYDYYDNGCGNNAQNNDYFDYNAGNNNLNSNDNDDDDDGGLDDETYRVFLHQLIEARKSSAAKRKQGQFIPATKKYLNSGFGQRSKLLTPNLIKNLLYLCENIINGKITVENISPADGVNALHY
ncbi:Hypothetical predicted protein [Paramuricea clavata]|uniref:Uncharacterized protein n=1 Tax=Paramuricea clavata TaxID=317549 RepID=A0A7D9ERF0_PARCT|nr:Hypothetical predicted protein [Paramuricea clavata]